MTRVTFSILIILILMNGTLGIMDASGLSEDLGVNFAGGVNEDLEQAVDNAEKGFQPNQGAIETLFTLFASGAKALVGMLKFIFIAPTFFMNLGFPSWVVTPLFAPVYIIATFEIISITTGRRTT